MRKINITQTGRPLKYVTENFKLLCLNIISSFHIFSHKFGEALEL